MRALDESQGFCPQLQRPGSRTVTLASVRIRGSSERLTIRTRARGPRNTPKLPPSSPSLRVAVAIAVTTSAVTVIGKSLDDELPTPPTPARTAGSHCCTLVVNRVTPRCTHYLDHDIFSIRPISSIRRRAWLAWSASLRIVPIPTRPSRSAGHSCPSFGKIHMVWSLVNVPLC